MLSTPRFLHFLTLKRERKKKLFRTGELYLYKGRKKNLRRGKIRKEIIYIFSLFLERKKNIYNEKEEVFSGREREIYEVESKKKKKKLKSRRRGGENKESKKNPPYWIDDGWRLFFFLVEKKTF